MGDAVPPPAPAFPLGLQAVAFWSDRVPDWPTARQLLRSGSAPAEGEPLRPPPPQMLQGAERRRASPAVALGLELARLALAEAGVDAQAVEAVFTSSHGDVMVTDEICRTLAQDPALLSPLRFHHSVHNAVAGYWSIATGNTRATTALAGHEHSFAGGLLEAALRVRQLGTPVLLVSLDLCPPPLMQALAPARQALGAALVLGPAGTGRQQLTLAAAPASAAAPVPLPAWLDGSYQPDLARFLCALARLDDNDPDGIATPFSAPGRTPPGAELRMSLGGQLDLAVALDG